MSLKRFFWFVNGSLACREDAFCVHIVGFLETLLETFPNAVVTCLCACFPLCNGICLVEPASILEESAAFRGFLLPLLVDKQDSAEKQGNNKEADHNAGRAVSLHIHCHSFQLRHCSGVWRSRCWCRQYFTFGNNWR